MTRKHKVTVFLLPKADEEGFIAVAPFFMDAATSGRTREEALAAAKEAIELALKDRDEDQGWYLELSHNPGAEIGEVEVEAPSDDRVLSKGSKA